MKDTHKRIGAARAALDDVLQGEGHMGLVTGINWVCPGCGSMQKAEAYGDWDDPDVFPVDAVPSNTSLKWNPPCTSCGLYRLVMPIVRVQCYPEAVPAVPKEEEL